MGKAISRNEMLRRQAAKKKVGTVIMISIFTFFAMVIIFLVLFFLLTKESANKTTFPDSPLDKAKSATYSYVPDSRLGITIKCPTIPVMLNVGGSERTVVDNGTIFAYSNDLFVSVYETLDSSYGILAGQYASDLYLGNLSGTPVYNADKTDVGYFNGYPAEWQAGTIELIDSQNRASKKIYVLNLTLELGFDKKLVLIVSTTDAAKLYDANILLQSVGYTIMDISQTNYIDDATLDYENRFPNAEFNGTTITVDDIAKETMEEMNGTDY